MHTNNKKLFAEENLLAPPPFEQALKRPPAPQEVLLSKEFQHQMLLGVTVKAFVKRQEKKPVLLKLMLSCHALLQLFTPSEELQLLMDIRNTNIKPTQSCRARTVTSDDQADVQLIERGNRVILLLDSQTRRNDISDGFHLLQRIYNSAQPYDEQFTVEHRQFFLTCDEKSQVSLGQFLMLVQGLGHYNRRLNYSILGMVLGYDPQTAVAIGYSEFSEFLRLSFASAPEVIDIFNENCQRQIKTSEGTASRELMKPLMLMSEFCLFLEKVQGHTANEIRKILKKMASKWRLFPAISVYVFGRYLYSNTNNLFSPHRRRLYQDMNRPLNQYYCYSSHNTYLTGNQLNSESSLERYVEDLENGVRCVQIDVHNDYTSIKVTHGFTRTGKLSFQQVVRTLARFSDLNYNHLPIMLSIEVHLHWRNIQIMVDILLHYLGPKILIIEKEFVQFPTALELRNKIMLQTYEVAQYNMRTSITQSIQSALKAFNVKTENTDKVLKFLDLEPQANTIDGLFIPMPIQNLVSGLLMASNNITSTYEANVAHQRIDAALPRLRQDLLEWKLMRDWIMEDAHTCMNKVTSMYKGQTHLGQPTFFEYVNKDWLSLIRAARKQPDKLVKYTSKGWCRVYPHGLQFFSANYNPIPFLEMGAQFISLNTQALETYRYLLHGHFSENYSGYILKPDELTKGKFVQPSYQRLAMRVISTNNIRHKNSYECFEYGVRVGFFGSVDDCLPNNRNGDMRDVTEKVKTPNMKFEYASTVILELSQPYFAFLLFEIPGLGCNAMPVRAMRTGIRLVQLLDDRFRAIEGAGILVHISILPIKQK